MRRPIDKFFADRGTHLAAMIAYFALLSLVPLVFLALALLGLFGRADESTYLVRELQAIFPSSIGSIVRVVRTIQDNAATLGLIGAALLAWTSLSLFSALESAFNIVYDRPNRSFVHGKAVALILMISSLIVLFAGLVVGAFGFNLLRDYAPGFIGNEVVALVLSIVLSTLATFGFLVSVYYLLTNVKLAVRDVLPGAVLATVLLQTTFQLLPLYAWLTEDLVTLRAFSGLPILLIWLYVMANVIVFGAEVNCWLSRPEPREGDELAGLA